MNIEWLLQTSNYFFFLGSSLIKLDSKNKVDDFLTTLSFY